MSNKKLVGRTAILAAICSADVLPSAVFIPHKVLTVPYCAHILRDDDLSFTEKFLQVARDAAELPADGSRDAEMVAHVWPFYEDFPHQSYQCTGCGMSDKAARGHYISDNNEACRKTAEACA